MNKRGEAQLIELLKMGDKDAVEYWFNYFHPKLLQFIKVRLSSEQDAEELTQQTFLNCLKNLPLFLGTARLWTWMVSIAKHEVADYYRKKYAKRAIQTFPLSQLLFSHTIEDSHEVSARVLAVLKKMSAASRELLLRKYVDSQKVSQIALELGKTVKAVESDLFRARQEFKVLYVAEESYGY